MVRLKINVLIIPLLLILHFFLLISSSFTVWPEMILYPYFMNNGFSLFKDIVNPYFPGLSIILSQFFQTFGISIGSLKIFTFICIFFLDLLVFFSAYALSRNIASAVVALFLYILLHPSFGGNGLWFELALAPFVVHGLVTVYQNSLSIKQLILSGLSLGVAVLIKQNALLFFIPVFLLFYYRKQWMNFFYFCVPVIFLGIASLIYIQTNGILEDFIFWAIQLPLSYASQPGFVYLPSKKWYLLMVFLMLPVFALIKREFKLPERLYWVLVFLISLSFAFPRFENFHLQALIPFSAIFSCFFYKKVRLFYLLLAGFLLLTTTSNVLNKQDRFLDSDMFLLSSIISEYPSVYLLNSPDLAYFFGHKIPPKPWAINFPWYFEQPGFQDRFISGIEIEQTEYIVVRKRLGGGEFDLGNYIPKKVLAHIHSEYTLVSSIDKFDVFKRR